MIILSSMMPLHGSPTEVKEEQEKRQQQHLAYATPTITPPPPSSSLLPFPILLILTFRCRRLGMYS